MTQASAKVLPTQEQREAISAYRTSVALSSGAGCGKTTVLSQRFLALLEGEHRLPLSRIVALTFTNKAARELRERIRREARSRAESAEDRSYWTGIVRALDTASIGTFHSFCGDIIRRYAIEAGMDPGFEILDEVLAPTIQEKALDSCMRQWLASQNPDFAALAVEYGLTAVRDALADILDSRPPVDLELWSTLSPQQVVERWERFRDRNAGDLVRPFVQKHSSLLSLLAANQPTNATMKARCDRLLAELPEVHRLARPFAAIEELLDVARVQGGGGKKAWESESIYEAVQTRLTKLREGIKDLVSLNELDGDRSLAAAEAGILFARLAKEALASYQTVKADEAVLDYSDLQLHAYQLLHNGPPSIVQDLRSSVSAILVDEFQDTDSIQAGILEVIAGKDAVNGRLFLVGDPKQSIYGFRGAEPKIFDLFRSQFSEAGRLNLTANYRSVPGILAFVNVLFGETFPGTENILRPGGSHDAANQSACECVEFLWAECPEKSLAETRRNVEAEAVAQLIASRLETGWMIRDGRGRPLRRAKPGDVAILFRARSDFPIYERALAAADLDYHVVGGSTFYAQQEVIDILNLLSTVEDPLDPLALAGTLRGPFFGLSDEGLYWLSSSQEGDLTSTFEHGESVLELLTPDDREAVLRARASLSRWRGWKDHLPIADLLDGALRESGFEAALMGEFLGDRKRANVRKLVALGRRFDERGSFGLADFVARLRADVNSPPREQEAATTDDAGEAVHLMTIHQAKGLEFPIVVVADLDRKTQVETQLVTSHPELGFLPRAIEDVPEGTPTPRCLGRELAAGLRVQAEHEEALRVFYVATTRAMDHLILSAATSPQERPTSPAMQLLDQRFDRSTGEAIDQHSGGELKVGVVSVNGALSLAKAKPAKYRPKLLFTARQILQSPLQELTQVTDSRDIEPSFVNLDVRELLSPTLQRVHDLVRAAFAEFGTEPDSDLGQALERAVERLGIHASDRVRELASERLRIWGSRAVSRQVAEATRVRRGLHWTRCWPTESVEATVYRGRVDFALLGQDGTWHLVNSVVSTESEVISRARAELLLSARGLESRGVQPVREASLVVLEGAGDCLRCERFDDETIMASVKLAELH